jgi:DnaK suppressor protein
MSWGGLGGAQSKGSTEREVWPRNMTLNVKEQYRKRLEAQIEEVERDLAQLEERLGEKGDYSLGEGDPSIYLWEMNLARRQRLQARLDELRAAVARLQAGTYETCSRCGEQIESGRLELLPTTRVCSRCARGEK